MEPQQETTPFATVVNDELKIIERRRKRFYPNATGGETANCLVGVTLSGGGIRSASTNLGVLYEMARVGLFKSVDYLSTVSGGGYIGCCLASLLSLNQPKPRREEENDGRQIYDFGSHPEQQGLFSEDWIRFPFRDLPLQTATAEEAVDNDPDPVGDSPQFCKPFTSHDQIYHLRDRASYLLPRALPLAMPTLRMIGATLTTSLVSLLWFFAMVLTASCLYIFTILPQWQVEFRQTAHSPGPEQPQMAVRVSMGSAATDISLPQASRKTPGLTDRALTAAREVNARILGQIRLFFHGRYQIMSIIALALLGVFLGCCAPYAGRRQCFHGCDPSPPGRRSEDRDNASATGLLRFVALRTTILFALVLAVVALSTYGCKPASLPDPRFLLLPWLAVSLFVGSMFHYTAIAGRCEDNGDDHGGWTRVRRTDMALWSGVFLYAFLICLVLATLPAVISMGNLEFLLMILGLLVLGLRFYFQQAGKTTPKRNLQGMKALLSKIFHGFMGLLVPIFLLLSVVGVSCLLRDILKRIVSPSSNELGLMLATVGGILLLGGGLTWWLLHRNFNRISPHIFYKDRLSEEFLQTYRRNEGKTEEETRLSLARNSIEMRLTDLHGNLDGASDGKAETCAAHGPYLLINATLNLTAVRDLKGFRRQATSFLFSRCYTGCDRTGYVPTALYNTPNLQLGRVMAVSGAAFTSVRGAGGSLAESFACTIFGVRLGYWLRHPARMLGERKPPLWHWHNLLYELFRYTHTRKNHIYLSDGGHCGDNLGILPLLKRRVKLIIASDAECDPEHLFDSLISSIRRAYVDMNIKVSINLDDLQLDEGGFTRKHHAIGRIFYPDRPWQKSWLLVIKNTMTGRESVPILNYHKKSPGFPHETTADQFFTEEQFEAYRSLGREAFSEIWADCREFLASPAWLSHPWSAIDDFCETLAKGDETGATRAAKSIAEDDIISAIWKCETGDFSTWNGFHATVENCFQSLPKQEKVSPTFPMARQLHDLRTWLNTHHGRFKEFQAQYGIPRTWQQFETLCEEV